MADRNVLMARRGRRIGPYDRPNQPQQQFAPLPQPQQPLPQQIPPPAGRGRGRGLVSASMPFSNLPEHVQARQHRRRVLNPPRDPNPDRHGKYIPKAVLNCDLEWVSHARIKAYMYYATHVANPRRMQAGSQSVENWEHVAQRYNLVVGRGNHQNTIRGMVRPVAGMLAPPPVYNEDASKNYFS